MKNVSKLPPRESKPSQVHRLKLGRTLYLEPHTGFIMPHHEKARGPQRDLIGLPGVDVGKENTGESPTREKVREAVAFLNRNAMAEDSPFGDARLTDEEEIAKYGTDSALEKLLVETGCRNKGVDVLEAVTRLIDVVLPINCQPDEFEAHFPRTHRSDVFAFQLFNEMDPSTGELNLDMNFILRQTAPANAGMILMRDRMKHEISGQEVIGISKMIQAYAVIVAALRRMNIPAHVAFAVSQDRNSPSDEVRVPMAAILNPGANIPMFTFSSREHPVIEALDIYSEKAVMSTLSSIAAIDTMKKAMDEVERRIMTMEGTALDKASALINDAGFKAMLEYAGDLLYYAHSLWPDSDDSKSYFHIFAPLKIITDTMSSFMGHWGGEAGRYLDTLPEAIRMHTPNRRKALEVGDMAVRLANAAGDSFREKLIADEQQNGGDSQ